MYLNLLGDSKASQVDSRAYHTEYPDLGEGSDSMCTGRLPILP